MRGPERLLLAGGRREEGGRKREEARGTRHEARGGGKDAVVKTQDAVGSGALYGQPEHEVSSSQQEAGMQ